MKDTVRLLTLDHPDTTSPSDDGEEQTDAGRGLDQSAIRHSEDGIFLSLPRIR